jgi:hypothetical protein
LRLKLRRGRTACHSQSLNQSLGRWSNSGYEGWLQALGWLLCRQFGRHSGCMRVDESSEFGDSWLAGVHSLQLLDCLYRFLEKAILEIEVDLNAGLLIVE